MFQFPGFPSYTYGFSIWSMVLHHGCSHIRKSADRSLYAAPRSLSQLVTSFVGSQCQGILHMLFHAWTTFWLSFDFQLFSRLLELLWSYIFQLLSFFRQQNFSFFTCFFRHPSFDDVLGKTWFLKSFSLYYVCHVYDNNFLHCYLFSYSVFNER